MYIVPVLAACLAVTILALLAAIRLATHGAGSPDRLARVEAKIDRLLAELDVTYDPMAALPANVKAALDRGETIEAIKLLRQATGMGLKDAKDRIDLARAK